VTPSWRKRARPAVHGLACWPQGLRAAAEFPSPAQRCARRAEPAAPGTATLGARMTPRPALTPSPLRLGAALGSLRLTVGLLAAAALLVVAGTLAQARQGLWSVQAEYFHAWVVYVRAGGLAVPVFPGGRTLGLLLLANLGAAAARVRGRGSAGLGAIHLGVLLLLGGSLLSGLLRTEYRLRLTPGEPAARLEVPRELELAVADAADPRAAAVLVRPLADLRPDLQLGLALRRHGARLRPARAARAPRSR
jgi:hypothetical protein